MVLPVDLDGQLQGFEDRFMRPLGLSIAPSQQDFPTDRDLTDAVEQSENTLSILS